MAAWVAPLISAGASLLGGLFGKKEQKTTSTIDYSAMREAAEKAGFNPLTALRAGGGAGFTTTHHPALASGGFIADALNGVANAVAAIDPMRDAAAKLELQIQQETLKSLQNSNAGLRRASIGGVPVAAGQRVAAVNSPLATGPVPSGPLDRREPTTDTPTRVNPYPSWLTRQGWQINPWNVSAQNWEDWMGDNEIASTVFSIGQLGSDIVWNGGRLAREAYRWSAPAKSQTKMPNYGKPYSTNPVFQ